MRRVAHAGDLPKARQRVAALRKSFGSRCLDVQAEGDRFGVVEQDMLGHTAEVVERLAQAGAPRCYGFAGTGDVKRL